MLYSSPEQGCNGVCIIGAALYVMFMTDLLISAGGKSRDTKNKDVSWCWVGSRDRLDGPVAGQA